MRGRVTTVHQKCFSQKSQQFTVQEFNHDSSFTQHGWLGLTTLPMLEWQLCLETAIQRRKQTKDTHGIRKGSLPWQLHLVRNLSCQVELSRKRTFTHSMSTGATEKSLHSKDTHLGRWYENHYISTTLSCFSNIIETDFSFHQDQLSSIYTRHTCKHSSFIAVLAWIHSSCTLWYMLD